MTILRRWQVPHIRRVLERRRKGRELSDAELNPRRRRISLVVATLVALSALAASLMLRQLISPDHLDPNWLRERGTLLYDTARPLSMEPLLNHSGETLDPRVFEDHWNVLFFGYTYCPDICPTTLATLKQLLDELDSRQPGHRVRVFMVSVDPTRDRPERLAEYLGFFDQRFNGITGELPNILRFATDLHIAFRQAPVENEDDSYLVDHSTQLVLINPDGHHLGYFKQPLQPTMMAEALGAISAAF